MGGQKVKVAQGKCSVSKSKVSSWKGKTVQSLYKPFSTLLNSKKFNAVDTNKGVYLISGKIIASIGLKEGLLKYS